MEEISQDIYSFFTTATAFTDFVGTKLYPVVGNVETEVPFAVYRISQQQGITKDMSQFNVNLTGYFDPNEYDTCVQFLDAVTNLVKNSTFSWVSSEVNFIEDNQSFSATVNFIIEK
jgi:hypothetical protein